MAFLIALMRLVLRPVVLSKEVDPIQKVRQKELAVHCTIVYDQSLKLTELQYYILNGIVQAQKRKGGSHCLEIPFNRWILTF
jgi:hypothetical protein